METKNVAWIITVGNEIVNGVITDTNREAIARELRSAGIAVQGMSSVGDNIEDITDCLDMAAQRASITIVSGGLGPTEDDKTAQAAAAYLGEELVLNQEQLVKIEERFKAWGRPMSSSNKKQALIPQSAAAIPNDYGTAPGFLINKDGNLALFFPGVPRELIRMLREQGIPAISNSLGLRKLAFRTRTLLCYGLSESRLGEILNDLSMDEPGYHLAFLPSFPYIKLRIDVFGEHEDGLDELLEKKEALIVQRAPENIISKVGLSLEEEVLGILKENNLTIGLAESITGGLIGDMITKVPGSSEVFMGSVVAYSNQAKIDLLGVSNEIIDRYGAVSHQCAREMAVGAARKFDARIGLSVTGIAGPGGGSKDKPVGTFYIGLIVDETLDSRGFLIPGSRDWIKTIAAVQSLDLLRRQQLGLRIHGAEMNS